MVTNSLSGSADGQAVQAGTIIGDVYLSQHPPRLVPWECPPAPRLFVGRAAELRQSAELCVEGQSVLLFHGAAGAGKSALALRLATEVRESFPDGQLYLNLRQYRRGGKVDLSAVVTKFLRSLGIAGDALSWELGEKTGLLRSLLRDKRMLILVDHVAMAGQVTEWLPDGPGVAVVVTSSVELTGLRRYRPEQVEVAGLRVAEGVELLAEYCDRVEAEREAAEELVVVCGGLPAVLEVVGARLDDRKSLSVAQVAAELAAARSLASLPEDVRPVVTTALDGVFDDLPDQARRLYTLLGVHPGADLAFDTVKALMPDPEDHLIELRRAHLVDWDRTDAGRVRLREFAAAHAADKAEEHLSPEGREMARHRLVRHYLVLASAADLRAKGDRLRLAEHGAEVRTRAETLPGGKAALDALDVERHNLAGIVATAAEAGLHAETWQLCEALWPYYLDRTDHDDWVEIGRHGVEAAISVRDPAVESRMRSQLARALSETRAFDSAEEEARKAVELAERSGNQRVTAAAEEFAGKVCVARGAYDRGIPHLRRALQLNVDIGRQRGVAVQHHALAQALHLSGDNEAALDHADEALTLFESLSQPEPRNRGSVLLTKAKAQAALYREEEAEAALEQAIGLLRECGALKREAEALEQLAELDGEREAELLTAAKSIYLGLGHPEAVARVVDRLDRT
ncbi:NB-ARC domain-containing protein [Lentzea sp. NPDC054927]